MLRFSRAPNLRQRSCVEAGCLVVFNPERRQFRWLNASAWVLFDLCSGVTESELATAYCEATGAPVSPDAWLKLRSTLASLEASGLVVATKEER